MMDWNTNSPHSSVRAKRSGKGVCPTQRRCRPTLSPNPNWQRPSVTGSAALTEVLIQNSTSFFAPARSLSAGVDLGVPIYSGGSVRNSVKAAEVRVEAGQAGLRGTEASIFSQTVAAYMDVLADNAFGNYRTLLGAVTTSAAMAYYLTYLNNRKADARTGAM